MRRTGYGTQVKLMSAENQGWKHLTLSSVRIRNRRIRRFWNSRIQIRNNLYRSRSGSEYLNQQAIKLRKTMGYGFADLYQNVMDPEHSPFQIFLFHIGTAARAGWVGNVGKNQLGLSWEWCNKWRSSGYHTVVSLDWSVFFVVSGEMFYAPYKMAV
jgi:hypothetical protein